MNDDDAADDGLIYIGDAIIFLSIICRHMMNTHEWMTLFQPSMKSTWPWMSQKPLRRTRRSTSRARIIYSKTSSTRSNGTSDATSSSDSFRRRCHRYPSSNLSSISSTWVHTRHFFRVNALIAIDESTISKNYNPDFAASSFRSLYTTTKSRWRTLRRRRYFSRPIEHV